MTELALLLENTSVIHYVQSQFKKMKKHKLETNASITILAEQLKATHTVTRQSSDELAIKIDKKKNVDEIKRELTEVLSNIVDKDIDISLLYKFVKVNNEMINKVKRKIR
jgi:hypothetical protein